MAAPVNQYEGAFAIKTFRDNETRIQIVDWKSGEAATRGLSIAQPGDTVTNNTNDYGIPFLISDKDGKYGLLTTASHGGLLVQMLDAAGNEATFYAPGDAIGAGRGMALLGSDGALFRHLAVDAAGHVLMKVSGVQGADGSPAPSDILQVGGKDPAGNLQTFNVDPDGNIQAVITESGSAICIESETSLEDIAKDATKVFEYALPSGKFVAENALVAARGEVFVEVGVFDGTSFAPKFRWYQNPRDNKSISLKGLEIAGGANVKVRVAVTNLDGGLSSAYATMTGRIV